MKKVRVKRVHSTNKAVENDKFFYGTASLPSPGMGFLLYGDKMRDSIATSVVRSVEAVKETPTRIIFQTLNSTYELEVLE